MKNIFRFLITLLSISLVSCTDEVADREALDIKTAPVLLSPSSLNLVLNNATPDDIVTTVVWDHAAYEGTSTIVNYSIEFDSVGNDFDSPTVVATTTSKFKSFTVSELNSAALDAGFAPFVSNTIEVRIKSFVGTTGSLPQVSNVFTFTLTPYPSWPNWGIIGSSTPTGWGSDTNMDYDLTTHLYSITIPMTVGAYKFRLDDGWGTNFGDNGIDLTLDANGADIPITVAGTYKIVVNFSSVAIGSFPAKSYTATLQ